MSVDARAVAALFDLGEPVAPLRRLPGRSSARVWALDTVAGQWVVKTAQPSGPAALDALRTASTLEAAAQAAGVAGAPAVTIGSAAGSWAPLPGAPGTYVRVSERLAGQPPPVPLTEPLAAWLGTSVARITGLGLPAKRRRSRSPQWQRLLPDLLAPAEQDQLLAAARAAGDLIVAANQPRPRRVLAHRDINRRNVLVTGNGPVLLDFDRAGGEVPWWELVHHTFLLACTNLGPEEPDPASVRHAVAGYLQAGGEPGPADPSAFAGLLAGLLDWVASAAETVSDNQPDNHVGAAADEQPSGDHTRTVLRQAAASLPLVVSALPRWSALLA